jgi:hypothetical protein
VVFGVERREAGPHVSLKPWIPPVSPFIKSTQAARATANSRTAWDEFTGSAIQTIFRFPVVILAYMAVNPWPIIC